MIRKFFTLPRERKWEIALLCAIVGIGIFLRTYHFSDWLLFEIDQTYDTRIVSHAIENGIANLPLLGPTAGGGRALRLGPAFYYMEYGSALIFGDTPTGHAMLVLISSLLAIPLFFVFCRRYFDTNLSLALVAIFSASAYLVLYGRFSWSPNVLPFLTLLSFYSLLRAVSDTEKNRDRWFLFSTSAIAITAQIHFNAFFTLPTIAILFLLYKRPRFPIQTWIMALGLIALAFSPMIFSDIATHGENTNFFLKKISKTGGSPLDTLKNFPKKFIVDTQYTASEYFLVSSGIDHINGGRLKGYGFQNTDDLPWRLFAIALFLIEIIVLIRNIRNESDPERRDFLILILLWTLIPFAYFYSLISGNFQIYPRFALLIAPTSIILLGLLLEKIHPEKGIGRRTALILITILLLLSNTRRLGMHFRQLENPEIGKNPIETEDIFPNNKRLTLQEQLAITDYLFEQKENNSFPIYLSTLHEYEPVFWYHLAKKDIQYSGGIDENQLFAEGNYFLIRPSSDGLGRAFLGSFTVSDEKNFGALTVYTLSPRPEKIKGLRQPPEKKFSLEQTRQIEDLVTWKTFLDR
jgi:4-amino-4-deoxy-L-arabinose transferase-like glycosyltransferase